MSGKLLVRDFERKVSYCEDSSNLVAPIHDNQTAHVVFLHDFGSVGYRLILITNERFFSHDFTDCSEVRVASFRNGVDNDVPLGNRTEELVFFNDGKQADVVIPHLL
jgi:hypothetical protein